MNAILGISIIDGDVQAVELSRLFSPPTLTAVGQWRQDPEAGPEAFRDHLSSFLNANKIQARDVSLSLDSGSMLIHSMPVDPSASREQLLERMVWEASQLMPGVPPGDLVIDVSLLERVDDAQPQRALGVAIRKAEVRSMRDIFVGLGLSLHIVDADQFSAETLLVSTGGTSMKDRIALVGIKRQRIDVSILDHGRLVAYGASAAGTAETAAAALAEALRSEAPVQAIVAHGPRCTPAALTAIHESTGVPAEPLNPFSIIPISKELPLAGHFLHQPHRFAAAVGVALREE